MDSHQAIIYGPPTLTKSIVKEEIKDKYPDHSQPNTYYTRLNSKIKYSGETNKYLNIHELIYILKK